HAVLPFFLLSSRNLRPPHSFPTRRSSDLSTGGLRKIIARNHQFLGVNRAIEAVKERKSRQGKLGVFWHTQGAGKSYSMVMFTRKDRKSTRLNSSHVKISYAVFCLKKKTKA